MDEKLIIKIKNKLPEIQRIMKKIENFLHSHNISPRIIFDTNLSLDELITNIINYGYKDDKEHEIFIRLHIKEDILVIFLEDDGIAFNPIIRVTPEHLEHPLEDKPIGGLGIHLVKNLMDNIEYKRKDNKNLLILTKKIKKNDNK